MIIRAILLTFCLPYVHNKDVITVGRVSDLPRNLPSNTTKLDICITEQTELTPDDFERFTLLDYLSIDHGAVSSFRPETFRNLTSLTYLSLFNNSITSLPLRAFPPSLRQIDLGYNIIVTIRRHMFYRLENVTNLRLHRNIIANIQAGALDPLVKLTVLELQGNHLTEFPRGLRLNQLTKLDLSGNKISTLTSDVFAGLPKLETFTIESNNIRTLPIELDKIFKTLNSISVANNPIHCNCFTKWLGDNRSLHRKIGNGKCATPMVISLAGSTVHECSAPNIIISPTYDIETTAGQEFTIECKAKSDPAPRITFYIDGEYYATWPAPTDVSQNEFAIKLSSTARTNTSYTCLAENMEGSTNVTRNVVVFAEEPPPPSQSTQPPLSQSQQPPQQTTSQSPQPPPLSQSQQPPQLTTSEIVSGSGPDMIGIGVGVGVGVLALVGVVVAVVVVKMKKANTAQVAP